MAPRIQITGPKALRIRLKRPIEMAFWAHIYENEGRTLRNRKNVPKMQFSPFNLHAFARSPGIITSYLISNPQEAFPEG